jgi:hypothetical protein
MTGVPKAIAFIMTRPSQALRPNVDRMAASYCGRDILELGRSTFGTDKGERPIAKAKRGLKGSVRGTLSKSHQQPMIGIGSPMQGP